MMTPIAWKPVTLAVVIAFLLGAGFGTARVHQQFFCIPKYTAEQKKEKLLSRFIAELRLNTEQTSRVKKILDAKTEKMEALRAEIRPRFKAIRMEMQQEIVAVLAPDQRVRFYTMEREWEASKQQWRSS